MNMLLIAALGILPFQDGEAVFDATQHVVAVQAVSATANSTVRLESVQRYVTHSEVSHPETNVVNVVSNIPYSVTNTYDIITNVVGGVTNYIDVVTNVVGGVTNIIDIFTNVINSARRVECSVTNVTTVMEKRTNVHWMTNVLLDVTLNSGRLNCLTNIYIPVSQVLYTGTASTNGILTVFVDN